MEKRQITKIGAAGEFFNQLMGNNTTEPEVGKGATILHYSDRSAFDVTWVSADGMECKIRSCKCIYMGETIGDETYLYEPDEESPEMLLRWNPRRSKWQRVSKVIYVIKARKKELIDKHGDFKWTDGLPGMFGKTIREITYQPEDVEYDHSSAFYQYKLIPGITKEYEEKHDVSVIFGIRQKYRDFHF